MKPKVSVVVALIVVLASSGNLHSADTNSPPELLAGVVRNLSSILSRPREGAPRTVTARIRILEGESLPKDLLNAPIELAFQTPDRLKVSCHINDAEYSLGRNGQELWAYDGGKKFGVLGKSGVPKFKSSPARLDDTKLPPIVLFLKPDQIALIPLLAKVEAAPNETIDERGCRVLSVQMFPETRQAFNWPDGEVQVCLADSEALPVKIRYRDQSSSHLLIEVDHIEAGAGWAPERWQPTLPSGQKLETVPLFTLVKFFQIAIAGLTEKIPTLGPANNKRSVIAREGAGRLEIIDDTRVLFLKGSPEEMGHQHGVLLKKQVRNAGEKILYGVGVGSSFEKGKWFFGEIESAQARLRPYMNERYVREMDALASASGLEPEEIHLANYFPELFHCSGFALFGKATKDGKMYHGRVLDYMRGVGLEQNAVVMVLQPDRGNPWVNITYAGFIGSVTAMNAKNIGIGEMGGRGEGNWNGKPMAQLVREVMENANTIDDALRIMKKGPRTCEYYYVISDAKTKRAVGIHATPERFETVWPGESHPLLPHKIRDAVLMSAGERYETLTQRVQENYGQFDAAACLKLMCRPVAMKSNLHSVLFAPESLDFWVANADSQKPACEARYTHYNLAELLQEKTEQP